MVDGLSIRFLVSENNAADLKGVEAIKQAWLREPKTLSLQLKIARQIEVEGKRGIATDNLLLSGNKWRRESTGSESHFG